MLYPNVGAASALAETDELERRFTTTMLDAKVRGCESELNAFTDACKKTKAVFNCPLERLQRSVASGTEVFETYYDLERLRVRAEGSGDVDWERRRPQAEIELLGSERHIDQLSYALLSIDGEGLPGTYGECTSVLKESMVAHRSSCFEENTAVFWDKTKSFPPGRRSDWSNRHKLCTAKLGCEVHRATRPTDFPRILLSPGRTSLDDNFVEVQVFGPMTARTLESVSICSKKLTGKKAIWKAVKAKLDMAGVRTSEI
jgi:hypothetical protein